MIIYSDDDEDDEEEPEAEEEDDQSDAASSSEPENLPEPVDVEEDSEPEPAGDFHETEDALEGADLFRDVAIERDPSEVGVESPVLDDNEDPFSGQKEPDYSGELQDEEAEENDPIIPTVAESSPGSDSSVDLDDLAFNFTADEMRRIRRKRKEDRREAKRNQVLLEKRRQEELAKAKKDRFFDKSRILPNEIYFGDIVVPMHVLHTYGSREAKSKPQQHSPAGRFAPLSYVPKKRVVGRSVAADSYNPRLAMVKKYLSAAGIKQCQYKSAIKRCTDDTQAIAAMLRVLREHGLEGEPSIAKCRELRQRRECIIDDIECLDTSLIINPTGRTLRSGTVITKTEYKNESPLKDVLDKQETLAIAEENSTMDVVKPEQPIEGVHVEEQAATTVTQSTE